MADDVKRILRRPEIRRMLKKADAELRAIAARKFDTDAQTADELRKSMAAQGRARLEEIRALVGRTIFAIEVQLGKQAAELVRESAAATWSTITAKLQAQIETWESASGSNR